MGIGKQITALTVREGAPSAFSVAKLLFDNIAKFLHILTEVI